MPQIFPLNSVRNFRDFGGYRNTKEGALSEGLLFRSAHFNETNDEDRQFLSDLQLGLIVDLRHKPERVRQPNHYPSDKDVLTFTMNEPGEAPEFAPHEMFLKEQLQKAEDARNYMIGSYTARPNSPAFIDIFQRSLEFMAEEGKPIVVHCAAGKDRTGTLVAIIQKILGLTDDQIMEDYMLTMKAVDVESFLEPAAKFMSDRFKRNIDPEALRPMFGVEPGFLNAALGAMGSFDDYLRETLSIDGKTIEKIRENYLT